MLNTESQFQPTDNVTYTRLDDTEMVLLNLQTNSYYSLNQTGARIWEQIVQGGTRQQIADALITEFDVTEKEALAHVNELLDNLCTEQLIEPVE